MQITWTNCAEQMPPDGIEIICKSMRFVGINDLYITSGLILHKYYTRLALDVTSWTPYTEEKWKELNK